MMQGADEGQGKVRIEGVGEDRGAGENRELRGEERTECG